MTEIVNWTNKKSITFAFRNVYLRIHASLGGQARTFESVRAGRTLFMHNSYILIGTERCDRDDSAARCTCRRSPRESEHLRLNRFARERESGSERRVRFYEDRDGGAPRRGYRRQRDRDETGARRGSPNRYHFARCACFSTLIPRRVLLLYARRREPREAVPSRTRLSVTECPTGTLALWEVAGSTEKRGQTNLRETETCC